MSDCQHHPGSILQPAFDALEMARALELYRERPNLENGVALRKHVAAHLMTKQISAMGPALAILEILTSRGHSSIHAYSRVLHKIAVKIIRRWFEKHPTRPGWNDYFMCRWILANDFEDAREIHYRARHIVNPDASVISFTPETPWNAVGFTANWMAESQRKENPQFDQALKFAEETCAHCHGPTWGRWMRVNHPGGCQ
jgi:hypothetical protein